MKLDITFVELTLNNQNYTDDNVPYYYYKPPKIFDVQPREGPTRGGTLLKILGSDFKVDKKIVCQFGTTKTRGKLINKNEVECRAPKYDEPGIVPLAITYEGDGQKFQSETVDFLYYETPTADSIDVTCGPTYGYT